MRDKFKYAECYKHEGYRALQRVCKVDAHKSKEQAQAEGWLENWKGNDAADATAKRARPEPEGKTKSTISALQARKKQLVELAHNVGHVCTDIANLKKMMVLQRADKAKKASILQRTITVAFGKRARVMRGALQEKAGAHWSGFGISTKA